MRDLLFTCDYLSYWEREALEKFAKNGLTYALIIERRINNPEFTISHWEALNFLLESFSIILALTEIDGLISVQAWGISKGLEKKDVLQLKNFWHIDSLVKFKKYGLTPDLLLQHTHTDTFEECHSSALAHLIEKRFFSPLNALLEIAYLTPDQVQGIANGLKREDVILLSNIWHISSMIKLKRYGLTSDLLLHRNSNGHEFDFNHERALFTLTTVYKFSIKEALAEIEGLSSSEVKQIESECLSDDFIHRTSTKLIRPRML